MGRVGKVSDALQHGIEALEDFEVPETQHPELKRAKVLGTAVIGGKVVGMLTAIEFDHKASLDCAEINDKGAERYLALELDSIEAMRAQVAPEDSLGIGLIAAQASSAI